MRRGSISTELLMCGGGVRSILLLTLVARCLKTIDVGFYVCCNDCVGVCGNVCCVSTVVRLDAPETIEPEEIAVVTVVAEINEIRRHERDVVFVPQ